MVDFKKDLFSYAFKNRVPLTVTIELLSECNFRCIHCYIDKDTQTKDILTYEEVITFGQQIIEKGCLYVVLTGGEVLLHPQFKEIYLFFVKNGVSVSVFTNGSLLNNEILKLFMKYPPRVVEITMYGYSADNYLKVTKRDVAETVRNNILELKNFGINVLLKMFIMRENYEEFSLIEEFARSKSIAFKYDTRIIAEAGSQKLTHQIDDQKVLELDFVKSSKNARYNEETLKYIYETRTNKLFQCGAGRCSCWLKSNNKLRVCNFMSNIEFDMSIISFSDAWDRIAEFIEQSIPKDSKCNDCKIRDFCLYCPAISLVEFGRFDMMFRDKLYCEHAMLRASSQK